MNALLMIPNGRVNVGVVKQCLPVETFLLLVSGHVGIVIMGGGN